VTTHGHVAGSQRRTIESLREANAGLCRELEQAKVLLASMCCVCEGDCCNGKRKAEAELRRAEQFWASAQERAEKLESERDALRRESQEWQDRCLATQTERDEWRTIAEELRSKLDEVARLYNSIRAERDAALGRLAVMTFGPEYIHSLAEEP